MYPTLLYYYGDETLPMFPLPGVSSYPELLQPPFVSKSPVPLLCRLVHQHNTVKVYRVTLSDSPPLPSRDPTSSLPLL